MGLPEVIKEKRVGGHRDGPGTEPLRNSNVNEPRKGTCEGAAGEVHGSLVLGKNDGLSSELEKYIQPFSLRVQDFYFSNG